ncbi:MAG: hypothetical protein HQM09_13625 [Candidatus Riflebacteria bacterium]|nr:hypothetical protein [Candidatus Riflebacteria bacterium]
MNDGLTITQSIVQYLAPASVTIPIAAENFDRTPTPLIVVLEIITVCVSVMLVKYLKRIRPDIIGRFAVMMAAVGSFEVFTMSMWNNFKLGFWAYVYRDVSWILMLAWTSLIMSVIFLVDRWKKEWRPEWRFPLILAILTLAVLPLDSLLIKVGVRSYTPEVEAVIWGRMPGLEVPWNILYYVPVFCGLILGFYRYWELILDNVPVMPFPNRLWLRDFTIAAIAVFMFEVMIEPMVENVGFPSWSYVYRDISFLLTLGWVVMIGLGLKAVDTFFIHYDSIKRFLLYVSLLTCMAVPLEAYMMAKGIRVYSPTTAMNFSGFRVPILDVPIEVVGGFMLYFSLVVGFIRYWEIILDQRRLGHEK